MKKIMALSISLLVVSANNVIFAMNKLENISFTPVGSGQDLGKRKAILTESYGRMASEGSEEYIQQGAEGVFSVLEEWVKTKEADFIDINDTSDGERLIGFTVLEDINGKGENIAMHTTPIKETHKWLYATDFDEEVVKEKFPGAKTISVTCSSHLKPLVNIIIERGYKEDPLYKCNEKLVDQLKKIPGHKGLTGYTKVLKK